MKINRTNGMIVQFVLCYGDLEQNSIDQVCADGVAQHAEDERQADAERELELDPHEPCDGADREYVEVAVAKEARCYGNGG